MSKGDISDIVSEVEDSPDRMAVNSLLSIDDVHEFNMGGKTIPQNNQEPETPKDWHQKSLPQRKIPQIRLFPEQPTAITVPHAVAPQLPQIRQINQAPTQQAQVAVKMNQSLTHVKARGRPTISPVPELPLSTPTFLLHDSSSQPSTSTSRPKPLRKLTDPRYLKIKRTQPLAHKLTGQSLAKVVFDGGQLVPPPMPMERPRPLPLLPPHLVELAKSLFEKSETSLDTRQTGHFERSAEPFLRKPSADVSDNGAGMRKLSREPPAERISNPGGPLKKLSSIHLSGYPGPQPTLGMDAASKRTQRAAFFGQAPLDGYDPRRRLPSLPHETSFTSNSGVKLVKTEASMVEGSETRTPAEQESRQPRYFGIKGALKVQDSPLLGSTLIKFGLSPPGFVKSKTRIHNFTKHSGFTDSSGDKFKSQIFSVFVHNRSLSTTPIADGPKQSGPARSQLRLNGITLFR